MLPVPNEVLLNTFSYLPLTGNGGQVDCTRVSKQWHSLNWAVIKTKFEGFGFSALDHPKEFIRTFIKDAEQYGQRSQEQIEKGLKLLDKPYNKLRLSDLYEVGLVDQQDVRTGKIYMGALRRLEMSANFLTCLRWVPAQQVADRIAPLLTWAAAHGLVLEDIKNSDPILQFLKEKKNDPTFNINWRNKSSNTLLHLICALPNPIRNLDTWDALAIVRFLVEELRANIHAKNLEGKAPVDLLGSDAMDCTDPQDKGRGISDFLSSANIEQTANRFTNLNLNIQRA